MVFINGVFIDVFEEIYIVDKLFSEYLSESWDYELSDGCYIIVNSKVVFKMVGWIVVYIGYG